MSEYLEYGGLEEATKDLCKAVSDFFNTDFSVLYNALSEVYAQGVEDARQEISSKIFSLETDKGRKIPWNPLTPNAERMAWGAGYAEARNQAGFIARGEK